MELETEALFFLTIAAVPSVIGAYVGAEGEGGAAAGQAGRRG